MVIALFDRMIDDLQSSCC